MTKSASIDSWRDVALEDVADELTVGYVGPMASEYVDEGIPFLRSLNVDPLRINKKDLKFITPEFHSRIRKSRLTPGDVVIVRTGKPGACSVVPEWLADGNCSDLVIVRCGPQLDNRFLAYYVNTVACAHVAAHLVGAVQQHFNVGSARTLRINLPPLAEQKAIAAVLGALDDKIELNRRMNATLEAMARTLFQSWFVDFDPVRAKLDGRPPAALDPATAALFPDSFHDSSIGPIPHGWTVGTIEEATSLIIDYRGRTPKKMGSDWSPTGVPAVSAKNVKAGRLVRPDTFNFVSEELYDRWMKDKLALGDILMTSEAPLGELYLLALDARFCLSQRIFAMRANPAVCEPAYLYYWLESPACQTDIINRGTGTTVEGIRQSELRKVSVLLPPLSIQKAAGQFLAEWTEQIHRNEEQSRTLAALRDSLLPKLLSGEVSVSDIPHSA